MHAFPRVLFDEAHSESWTIRREVAEAINPAHPDDNSYARAAGLLRHLGHTVTAHTEGPLDAGTLQEQDLLVIAHPSGERWERTTGQGSPVFAPAELDAVEAFVAGGGGLVVLAEEEQDKYGNNLAELLARFGVTVEHTTVRDPRHAHQGVATWVLAEPATADGLLAGVRDRLLLPQRGADRAGTPPPSCSPPRRTPPPRARRWRSRSGTARGAWWCSPIRTCSATTRSRTTTISGCGAT